MNGGKATALGSLNIYEEGDGNGPAVEGRVGVRAEAGNLCLTSPVPPFPIEPLRCLERCVHRVRATPPQ